MKKGIKALIIVLAVIAGLAVAGLVLSNNPRVRFLIAVSRFALETLPDSGFILYGVDIMEICRDYMDGDIEFEGDVIAGDIEGFGYTSSAKVYGKRSFDYREMSIKADAKVLFVDVGEVDIYGKDKTMYMIVPSFDNLAYSLTSSTDLFPKAPKLNGNLDLSWFRDNIKNFIDFSSDITIVRTGKTYESIEGPVSYEYYITIPEGKGEFIWELLGMDIPDHDISYSMYLTRSCKMNHIEMDLGSEIDNAYLTVDGASLGTCIMEKYLPDNEKATVIITKRADYLYANYLDVNMIYETREQDVYSAGGVVAYDKTDSGYDIQLKRLKAYRGETLIGQMYFDGEVHTTSINEPPTSDAALPLESIKNYEWEELRDNFEGFVDDVMEDVKAKL